MTTYSTYYLPTFYMQQHNIPNKIYICTFGYKYLVLPGFQNRFYFRISSINRISNKTSAYPTTHSIACTRHDRAINVEADEYNKREVPKGK